MPTDPISDMLARVRNAGKARHLETFIPFSKLKLAISTVLKEQGYLSNVHQETRQGHPVLRVEIRYDSRGLPMIDGSRRVSRPGRRVYVSKDEIVQVRNGLGIAVLSTSKGVMTDEAARQASLGGELLCEVW